jgi:hypothetical protein
MDRIYDMICTLAISTFSVMEAFFLVIYVYVGITGLLDTAQNGYSTKWKFNQILIPIMNIVYYNKNNNDALNDVVSYHR